MLSGLLHFINVPNGRCGVEVPAETADYKQSIFCLWSPTMELADSNQGNYSSLEQRMDAFEGSAFRNHTELEQGIQSLLERNDLDEAKMLLDHLYENNPVPFEKNERAELLRNDAMP